MWKDPIVEEVGKAREELARRANYDLHPLFENLRRNDKSDRERDHPGRI